MTFAVADDVIDCTMINNQTITLVNSLPALRNHLTVRNTSPNYVTIDGSSNQFQAFSVVDFAGINTDIQGFIVQNCFIKGGDGGSGSYSDASTFTCGGGGGGAGGGAALYVVDGAQAKISNMKFINNQAKGGAGGNSTSSAYDSLGGGGGGFGGGNGGSPGGYYGGGGGGGGGNVGGGNGGQDATGGEDFDAQNILGLGGGGGGGLGYVDDSPGYSSSDGGSADYNYVMMSTYAFSGGSSISSGSGGGGGAGVTSNGFDGTAYSGGDGGTAYGGGLYFSFEGGGGGGGDVEADGRANAKGGVGRGTGGGGGGRAGGDGGEYGGGGGGGVEYAAFGGFGAGGGGGIQANSSIGNVGGRGGKTSTGGGGGGGGAGLGGAIYVGTGATLTIGDLPLNAFSGNSVVAGAAGTSDVPGSVAATPGLALGMHIFVRAGGGLVFQNQNPLTISVPIESDYFNGGPFMVDVQSPSVVTLQGMNTFVGAKITQGSLSVSQDENLGVATIPLSIGNGTLEVTESFSSERSVSLTNSGSSINVLLNKELQLTGPVTGSGHLNKKGGGKLTLLNNTNQFAGSTVTQGTLEGNSASLIGNIDLAANTILIFNQPVEGVYSKILSGLNSSLLIKEGVGKLSLQGDSSGFTGTTTISAGELNVAGSIKNSPVTISSNGLLTGAGTVGSTMSSGKINPGNSVGTLHINGSLTLNANAITIIEIDNSGNDLIEVSGAASLQGTLQVKYNVTTYKGFNQVYTILKGNPVTGVFDSPVQTDSSNFTASVIYLYPTEVQLVTEVANPFVSCALENGNIQSVADNIVLLNQMGLLKNDLPLYGSINSLTSCDQVNEALDQLHPAQYSAFAEVQPDAGSQMLSCFQRRTIPRCCCLNSRRFWVEPFGTWLEEESKGDQVGFNSNNKGAAFGIDGELGSSWIAGIGGVWNRGSLHWKKNRGHGSGEGYYGAVYCDYFNESNFVGTTVIGGFDYFDVSRHIPFVHADADTSFRALDLMARLSAAHFFGSSLLALYPYLNLDLYYLKQDGFTEHHAPGFDLNVEENQSSTLRTELGVTIQSQDSNSSNTLCISPLISAAWVMEYPLQRKVYTSSFSQFSEPFQVKGWDHTWQIFLMRFGLNFNYKCFSLSADYSAEISSGSFFGQKGDVRLEFSW